MTAPLNIPDIPSTVTVTNTQNRVLKVSGLPDIPALASGVVIDLLGQQPNFIPEARRVHRWKEIAAMVAAGVLTYDAPNPLWGTIRIKNLAGRVVGFGGLIPDLASGEVRDVPMVNQMLSRRVKIWKALQAADDAGVILIELTPSTDNPTVTSITPATSDLAGGTPVTIHGEDFAPGATVTIGGVPCTSVVWVNDSTITAVTPTGTAGAKNVVVTNSGGHLGTLTNGFTYTAATFVSITPNNADLAGGAVTIVGTNFKTGATVTIGGVPCTSVVVVDAAHITCVAPVGTAGAKNVVITNPGSGGSVATGAGAFTYTAATFTSITPDNGAAAGSTSVAIVGTNFRPGATVSIGGVPCTGVVVSDSAHITAVTGAHGAGAVDVVITNPGTGGSTVTGVGAYTYT